METPFGLKKKENIFSKYIGKYIIVYPQHASTFAGKLTEIREDYLVLNPHAGGIYDENKGAIRVMKGSPAIVRLSDVVALEPTTRKSLEAFCKYSNKEAERITKGNQEIR